MWAKFDDKYIYHPKLQEAGWAAQCVDMRGIIYCAGQETDGVMHVSSLPTLLGDIPRWRGLVAKLVEVGRWHVQGHDCPDCPELLSTQYVIHDFLKFNLSKAKCEMEREKARERMARSRGSSGRTSGGSSAARANGTGLSLPGTRDFVQACPIHHGIIGMDCQCPPNLSVVEA